MNHTAIILAGGSGKRMGAGDAKQFLKLAGIPVLAHSIQTMEKAEEITDIVLVVRPGDEERIEREVLPCVYGENGRGKVRAIVHGGAERYDSVYAGLLAIRWPCGLVFIHDGARPFVTVQTIRALAQTAGKEQGACAGTPSKDTVKIADENGYVRETPNRRDVWIIQTPQVFEKDVITAAYAEAMAQKEALARAGVQITDDCMVAERFSSLPIRLVDAGSENIKVTEPSDLQIGEAILEGRRRRGEPAGRET